MSTGIKTTLTSVVKKSRDGQMGTKKNYIGITKLHPGLLKIHKNTEREPKLKI